LKKKKPQNLPSKTEISNIFEILKLVSWPGMVDDRLKISRKVWSKLFCHQNFFDRKNQKFTILIWKNIPPKKDPFGRGV
jgi:hypothetical protein